MSCRILQDISDFAGNRPDYTQGGGGNTSVKLDGRLMAEVVRTEACLQCHACQYGQKGRVLVELPEGDYRVGDTVELSLEDARSARASRN